MATAGSGAEALTRMEEQEFDVIVADVVMPGVSGLEILERSRALNPGTRVILMTAHATVEMVDRGLAQGRLRLPAEALRAPPISGAACSVSSGGEPWARADRAPAPRRPVATGRGPARWRERRPAPGARADRPLRSRPQQCADHRRERYWQGAGGRRRPRGEPPAPPAARSRELRRHPRFPAREPVLRSRARRFHERGADKSRACSSPPTVARSSSTRSASCPVPPGEAAARHRGEVRVGLSGPPGRSQSTCASSRAPTGSWPGEIEAGRFPANLFYRLNVVHVMLPPLREHREDIPLLVDHFIRRLNVKLDRRFLGI